MRLFSLILIFIFLYSCSGFTPLYKKKEILSYNLKDIAITTNGSLLTKDRCQNLFDYGLNRITVSLDALDPKIFSIMTTPDNKKAKFNATIFTIGEIEL